MKSLTIKSTMLFVLLCFTFSIYSCKKNDPVFFELPCDTSLLPVVMVHGFLASGDTYASHLMRLSTNRFCDEKLFAYDWNTLDNATAQEPLLDAFIDQVLAETGASQVILMGHSAGSSLGYNYLSEATRAAKVWKYVHLAGNPQSGGAGPNGEVPMLNLWSEDDTAVIGGETPGATNVKLTGEDHYEVATSDASFAAIYDFLFDGKAPIRNTIRPQERIIISGKALSLGENVPNAGATISIFAVDAATGERMKETPDYEFTSDANGHWGPYEVTKGQTYEFKVVGANAADRTVVYYREGFQRSNSLVYLRTLPPPTSLAGILLSGVPESDDESAVTIFTSSQAVVAGRDELTINDTVLSTPQFASADQTTIAFFLYDDGDGVSSGGPVGLFGSFPFLNGVDLFFPTTPRETITLKFNGRSLNVPNLKSESDGVIVAVFD